MQQNDLMRESIPHGDALFPMSLHEIATDCKHTERLECHWHKEIEILVATAGQAVFRIDTESFPLSAGEAVFVNGNRLHSARAAEMEPFEYFAVVFDLSLLSGEVNDRISQRYIAPVVNGSIAFSEKITREEYGGEVFGLLFAIREAYRKKELLYEMNIKIKLMEIWTILYRHAEKAQGPAPKAENYKIESIKRIMRYIQEHYREDITVSGMAERCGMSESQFCRFFRSMAQSSAVHYIQTCRVTESCRLLRTTDLPVSAVALQVGFENISYFNRVFLRFMHRSPSAFRAQENL
ncbi:MAG: AraC family transcriptional regulator [Oscillospiraceae bacterium]|jgi:AraC-like DNA-binding protein|nr:AraC family transcriptional regulator [Oscillospiraceae bacterium]MDD3260954.1 AraC family transcriptional regulator [Oscillospiraceae bacterium]